MGRVDVRELFFLPPLAIARVGGSETPLDAFVWDTDKSIHGANRTVIRPAVSLKVLADGTLRPYLPNTIQFRDGDLLRPVAPFFELWAWVERDGRASKEPLTLALLEELDVWLDSVEFHVTVGNRKAQRRTGSAACAYVAHVELAGDDHAPKPLMAFSPHNPGEEPLVSRAHPVPLGTFQAMQPIRRKSMDIDLSVLRVRFTPARGEVYGPPAAIAGPASPLPPGEALPPATLGGRQHEIVPEKNRILNAKTPWSAYVMDQSGQKDPQPSDSYDGANVGECRSWGVVDDTCDGVIEARLVIKGTRFVAKARVLSSCPDYAPDRRPFNSVADDLADRDKGPVRVAAGASIEEAEAEIADLFERAFETASLMNLDALRDRGVRENLGDPSAGRYPRPPHIGFQSMTDQDRPYASLTADLLQGSDAASSVGHAGLMYCDVAQYAHGRLCDIESLLDFLRQGGNADRVRKLIRPPFGRLADLRPQADANSDKTTGWRDPRVARSGFHDMRMPPYMRDSDQNPLSITYRQYQALMALVAHVARAPDRRGTAQAIVRRGTSERPDSPVARKIARFAARYRQLPAAKDPTE